MEREIQSMERENWGNIHEGTVRVYHIAVLDSSKPDEVAYFRGLTGFSNDAEFAEIFYSKKAAEDFCKKFKITSDNIVSETGGKITISIVEGTDPMPEFMARRYRYAAANNINDFYETEPTAEMKELRDTLDAALHNNFMNRRKPNEDKEEWNRLFDEASRLSGRVNSDVSEVGAVMEGTVEEVKKFFEDNGKELEI